MNLILVDNFFKFMSSKSSKKEKHPSSRHEKTRTLDEAIAEAKESTEKNVEKANERGDTINQIDKKSMSILEKARLYRKTAHKSKK